MKSSGTSFLKEQGFCEKGAPRNFTKFLGKHLCQGFFFNKVAGPYNFIKKETLALVFSCELCEISKNIFSYRTSLVSASDGSESDESGNDDESYNDYNEGIEAVVCRCSSK